MSEGAKQTNTKIITVKSKEGVRDAGSGGWGGGGAAGARAKPSLTIPEAKYPNASLTWAGWFRSWAEMSFKPSWK